MKNFFYLKRQLKFKIWQDKFEIKNHIEIFEHGIHAASELSMNHVGKVVRSSLTVNKLLVKHVFVLGP